MKNPSLDEVLSTLNSDAVIDFFKDMPEKERKEHLARALQWLEVSSLHNYNDVELRFWLSVPSEARLFSPGSQPPKRIQKLIERLSEAKITAKNLPPQAVQADAVAVSGIAVMATAGMTDIKKRTAIPPANYCYALLKDRKPTWLNNWVDWILVEAPLTHWLTIRRMEREQIIQPEHNSAYYTGMMLSLPGAEAGATSQFVDGARVQPVISEGTIVSLLTADEELLPELWNMFKNDQAMRTLLHQQTAPGWRESEQPAVQRRWMRINSAAPRWSKGLIQLCQEGKIDKGRLLQAVMTLFATFNLEHSESGSTLKINWFTDLYDQLEASLDERLAVLPDLLRLLSCRNPKVILWTLEKIAQVADHPDFPVGAACESIPTAFLLKGKEHAVQALKTLKAIADAHPGAKHEVAAATIDAMESENQEIHKRAITQLEKLKCRDDDLIARMESKLPRVAIVHRSEAARWAERKGTVMASDPHNVEAESKNGDQASSTNVVDLIKRGASKKSALNTPMSMTDAPQNKALQLNVGQPLLFDIDKIRQQCSNVPAALSRVAQLEYTLSALNETNPKLDALDLRGDGFPRLNPDKRLKKIATVDELVFFLMPLTAWDHRPTADQVEIVLDALARLGVDRPDDFRIRTEALRAKVEPLAGHSADPILLAAQAWTTGKMPSGWEQKLGPAWDLSPTVGNFARKRFRTVVNQMLQGRRVNLLSTPTHEGGWIDPLILVERIKRSFADDANGAHSTASTNPLSKPFFANLLSAVGLAKEKSNEAMFDQSLALLRLAPDNREAATTELLKSQRSEFVEAALYALGSNDVAIGTTAELWIAAARSRNPFGDDDRVEARFPRLGPDAACLARYQLKLVTESEPDLRTAIKDFRVFDRTPAFPPSTAADNLVTARMQRVDYIRLQMNELVDWRRTITPKNLDAFFAEGAEKLALNYGVDLNGKINVAYLQALYDPDIHVSDVVHVMLALAMASKQRDEHSTAIEALIAVIDDGRLDGSELGAVMGQMYRSNGVRPSDHKADHMPLISISRWAKALSPVARCSSYHAQVVARCIEQILSGDPNSAPKDVHMLLEVLLTCLIEEHDCIRSEGSRAYLAALNQGTGGSKTAKLVKQLLALEQGADYDIKKREALTYALGKSIERAERWADWQKRNSIVAAAEVVST